MNIASVLTQLENVQLVRRLAESESELEYIFKHTLTQESVYESMLKTRRAELHREIAYAIENLCGGQFDQNAAVLALHYERAGVEDKAFTFAALAGDIAARAYAHQEALMFYDRALTIAKRIGNPQWNACVRALYAGRGRVLEVKGAHGDAIENYRDMIGFGQRMTDTVMEADGLNHLLTTQGIIGDVPDADHQLARVLELARRSGDAALIGQALWNTGLAVRFTDPERAAEYFERALEHSRVANLPELAAYASTDLCVVLQFTGQWRKSHQYAQQALEEFRALDNQPMIANALGMLADEYYARAETARARAAAEEGKRISVAIENPWGIGYNGHTLVMLALDAGEFDEVLAQSERLLKTAREMEVDLFSGMTQMTLTRTFYELNQMERALTCVEESGRFFASTFPQASAVVMPGIRARILIRQNQVAQAHTLLEPLLHRERKISFDAWTLSLTGAAIPELALSEGRLAEGLSYCDWVIGLLEPEEGIAYAAEFYFMRGRIQLGLGNLDRAAGDLQRALEICEQANNKLLLWHVWADMAELAAKSGQSERADAARHRAAAIVESLASNISDSALRQSFLSRKDILEVFA